MVNISSQSSTIPLTEHLFYSSSKSAVDHVTRIQALELAQYNIRFLICVNGLFLNSDLFFSLFFRVNAVRPTVVMTQLALKQWDPEKLKQMENQIPLKRLATPLQVDHPFISHISFFSLPFAPQFPGGRDSGIFAQ